MGEPVTASKAPIRYAIIGTGPISLLKAYLVSLEFPKVEIHFFDAANQIGGAWYSDKTKSGYSIDSGCRIWSYAPKSYQFIEQQLGVKLFPMKPSPVFVGKFISIPYSLKTTIHSYKIFLKNLVKLNFSGLRNALKEPYIHLRLFGKKNLYPKSGAIELLQSLQSRISENDNIKIHLNTRISDITINGSVCIYMDQTKLIFDKVVITHLTEIKKIKTSTEILHLKSNETKYIHFLISSNKKFRKKFTHLRFMNDPIIHRITDISYQTNGEENLILVGVKQNAFETISENDLFLSICLLIKSRGIIDEISNLTFIKKYVYPTKYLDDDSIKLIKNLNQFIEILPSTDLMYGIHYLLKEHKII